MSPRRTDYYDDPNAPKPNALVPAASAIVVNDANEVLLHRRSDNELWALPGGTMELGESVLQTVVREVKEETGLDVTPGRVTGIYTDPRSVIAFADGEVRQQFSICFLCTIAGGELSVSSESTEVRFVVPADLDQLAISPTIRLRIRHYLENRPDPAVT